MSSKSVWLLCAAIATVLSVAMAGSAQAACPVTGCTGDPGGGVITYLLTVTVTGPGSVDAGSTSICDAASSPCTVRYEQDQDITLTGAGNSGYSLTGWGGACSGAGTCTFTMTGAKSVSASFADITAPPAPAITSPAVNAPPPSGSARASRSPVAMAVARPGRRFSLPHRQLGIRRVGRLHVALVTGSLSTGPHRLRLGLDPSGNVSGSRTFVQDRQPAETTSAARRPRRVNEQRTRRSPTAAPSAGIHVLRARLDGVGRWRAVPISAPRDGPHSHRGGRDLRRWATATRNTIPGPHWTVDTRAPDTAISGGPSGAVVVDRREFAFAGNDPRRTALGR